MFVIPEGNLLFRFARRKQNFTPQIASRSDKSIHKIALQGAFKETTRAEKAKVRLPAVTTKRDKMEVPQNSDNEPVPES